MVRPFVVAPANVQPDAVRRDARERVVERVHVQFGERLVLGIGVVLEHHVAPEAQVGRVELQHETRVDDGAVFRRHGIGNRFEVGLVVGVEPVRLEQRDHSRGCRVHETLERLVLRDRRLEIGDVQGDRLHVLDGDLADAARSPVRGGATGGGLPLEEPGILLQIPGRLPVAVAVETRDAVLDVGGVADLAHLAIAHDIDAARHLAGDDGIHRGADHLVPVRRLFALFASEHHVRYGLRARQAADVCGQDAVATRAHGDLRSGAALPERTVDRLQAHAMGCSQGVPNSREWESRKTRAAPWEALDSRFAR